MLPLSLMHDVNATNRKLFHTAIVTYLKFLFICCMIIVFRFTINILNHFCYNENQLIQIVLCKLPLKLDIFDLAILCLHFK